jgi:hypothetical protein
MAPKASSQPAKKTKSSQSKLNVVKLGGSQPNPTGNGAAKRRFDPLSAVRMPVKAAGLGPLED